MTTRIPLLLLPLLAGCFWLPGAGEEPYRITLEQIERSQTGRDSATPVRAAPVAGGYTDSLIAFRTQASLSGIHFRLRNRGAVPLTVLWDGSAVVWGRGEQVAVALGRWMSHGRDHGPPDVVLPGRSIEDDVIRVEAAKPGGAPKPVWLLSEEYDPAERRIALRVPLETAGTRYVYTFWYRVAEVRPDN